MAKLRCHAICDLGPEALLQVLNEHRYSQEWEPVLDALAVANRHQWMHGDPRKWPHGDDRYAMREHVPGPPEIEGLGSQITRMMAKFDIRPSLHGSANHWRIFWSVGDPQPQGGDPGEMNWMELETYVNQPMNPAEADQLLALLIMGAATAGYLQQIIRCDHCGQWLRRRVAGQEFCSSRCRERAFQSTTEYKAQRAEYMRKKRAEYRERDAEDKRRKAALEAANAERERHRAAARRRC